MTVQWQINRSLAPADWLAGHRLALGPLFRVARIIAYRRNWASSSDRRSLSREKDSDASHDYISSARIVSPDPVPSRTRHSSASLIILLIDQEERESLVFDLHAKGIIIVYLIESDLSLAFYDPITRGYRWREPRETRGRSGGCPRDRGSRCKESKPQLGRAHGMRTWKIRQRFRVAYACASSVRILIRGNRSSLGSRLLAGRGHEAAARVRKG